MKRASRFMPKSIRKGVTAAMPKDKNGREVRVGTRVRVLSLSESFLNSLPADEIEDVKSMIGEVFEVYEVDKYGAPWVGKGWHDAEAGDYRGHSVALDPSEMEVVD
jgi:hypothetical protein